MSLSPKGLVQNVDKITEEELQNYLEPVFRSVLFGEEYDLPTLEEQIETAIVTALSTSAMNARGNSVDAVSEISTKLQQLANEMHGVSETENTAQMDGVKYSIKRTQNMPWDEQAFEEVVADACQKMLLDTNAGQQLAEFGAQSEQNRDFLHRFAKKLREILNKLRSIFKNVQPDSLAAQEFARFDANTKQILADMFVDMSIDAGEKLSTIKEAGLTEKITTEDGGVKYRLMVFVRDGKRFVEIDQEQNRFDGHTVDEYPGIAKAIIKEKFENKVVGIDNRMFVNGEGRNEYAYPSKDIKDPAIYEAKMRASAELDNLLDAGTNFRNEPDGKDGHIHPDAIGGFDYFDTIFKIGNRYFKGVINIKNIKRGKLFKDVTKIEDITQDIMNSYGKNPKFQFLRTSSMNTIRNPDQNVNKNSEEFEKVPFKLPVSKDITDRAMLVDMFEQTVTNSKEYKALENYRKHIEEMQAIEEKLERISAEIRRLSFAEGPRDMETLNRLKLQKKHSGG